MESQLNGQNVSVILYNCHNSSGHLLKRRESEMFRTARLYRLGEAAQSKPLRNQPDFLITSRRIRPPDVLCVSDKTVVATEIEDCHVYSAEDQINNDPLTANTITFASERDTKQDKSIGTHSSFNDGVSLVTDTSVK
ncbi:hypothetical protein T07_11231 [Trichinella nelsoni]|uniref:Uncharacterized protein n=1 Tax=Trichinella nelsoni TaxID=6336 RepID=A0A0V0RI52_9BILA|nr:hypothetical protein T07_11231 [Trichinella nelsoni]